MHDGSKVRAIWPSVVHVVALNFRVHFALTVHVAAAVVPTVNII